jgi:anti-sigma B factor antagonist
MMGSIVFPATVSAGRTTIAIPAQLITGNRAELKAVVLELLTRGAGDIILDFTDCKYLDSSGLGVLVSLSKKVRDAGGTMEIIHLDDDLTTLFQFTRIDSLLLLRTPQPHGVRRGE